MYHILAHNRARFSLSDVAHKLVMSRLGDRLRAAIADIASGRKPELDFRFMGA